MIFLDPAMSKTDEEDLPCMLEGVEGQTGDKKAPVCEMGHKDRERLETLLKQPRTVQPLQDYRMKIRIGPGNEKKTSVKELAEEYRASKEGQLLLKSGSLTFPLVDYVKEKFGLKSVVTLERLEKEYVHLHIVESTSN